MRCDVAVVLNATGPFPATEDVSVMVGGEQVGWLINMAHPDDGPGWLAYVAGPADAARDVYGRGARGRHLGRFEQPAHAVGAILLNVDDDLVAVVRTRRLELERRLALPPDPGAPT